MANKRTRSAQERVDALPGVTDLDRYRILEIARKLQRSYSSYRRSINDAVRFIPKGEIDPGQWVGLASRLYRKKIDPDSYFTWATQQLFPLPVYPNTVGSHALFSRFLDEGFRQMHERLDFNIEYGVRCLLSRVSTTRTMLEVLRDEVGRVGYRSTEDTASGYLAASPDHLDVVVLYIACKTEPGAGALAAWLLPYAKSAMSRDPYLQSRIASQLPQELLDGNAFTASGPDSTTQTVHGDVPVPKPPGA